MGAEALKKAEKQNGFNFNLSAAQASLCPLLNKIRSLSQSLKTNFQRRLNKLNNYSQFVFSRKQIGMAKAGAGLLPGHARAGVSGRA
jgi:hypothetical protein